MQLPVPRTFTSDQLTTPEDVIRHLSLPCILKPNHRIGWFESEAVEQEGGESRKALRADDGHQLRRRYAAMRQFTEQFVIQEYIPGDTNCIYTFHAYCDRHSRILAHYVGRKIRAYPRDTGVSTYLELVEEPVLVRMAVEILKRLKFVGILKADFKKDPRSGRYYLLEINARFNLWNYLGMVCGVNLPQVAYADLLGYPCKPSSRYEPRAKWLSFGNDLRAFLREYHRDGTLSWFEWLRSYSGKKVYDLFSWRDPVPFIMGLFNYSQLLYHRLAKRAHHEICSRLGYSC
jgi:predicted ATP-grasp superfamily ATP-dependent carboligase